jgi:hypothetical protein
MVPIRPVVLEKKLVLHFKDLLLQYYMEDGIENCHE